MKKLFFILILLPLAGYSQKKEAAAYDTIFLDASWNVTQHREMARYYRKVFTNNSDSLLTIHDYYLSTGNRQMIGSYIHEMKPGNQHGRFEYFYPDGTIKAVYDYQWGIIHGELRRYYKNGVLKTIEQFDLGTKVDTTWSFYNNGQLHMIEIQNPDFSDENPSDKFMRTRLIASYSKTGEEQVSNGHGIYKEFYLSGKIKSAISYDKGFPHGKWIKYSGHKKKKSCVMTFKHGRFIKGEMYENGKKDIFSSLQRQAYYPSGIRGLIKYIDDHVGNCPDGFKNEVIVLLHISTTGKVKLDQIISGNVNACQFEEIQVIVANMPNWVPAVSEGEYVEGSHSVSINFSK